MPQRKMKKILDLFSSLFLHHVPTTVDKISLEKLFSESFSHFTK